jgi:hypothetical protein
LIERVTIDDVLAAGHCARGARAWFKRHGLDFRAFCRDGAAPGTLLSTGDELARKVIERAEARRG